MYSELYSGTKYTDIHIIFAHPQWLVRRKIGGILAKLGKYRALRGAYFQQVVKSRGRQRWVWLHV